MGAVWWERGAGGRTHRGRELVLPHGPKAARRMRLELAGVLRSYGALELI